MDIFERKDIKADKMFKGDGKETNDLTGKFTSRLRKFANKSFERGLIGWLFNIEQYLYIFVSHMYFISPCNTQT